MCSLPPPSPSLSIVLFPLVCLLPHSNLNCPVLRVRVTSCLWRFRIRTSLHSSINSQQTHISWSSYQTRIFVTTHKSTHRRRHTHTHNGHQPSKLRLILLFGYFCLFFSLSLESAATNLNIQVARPHFEKFVQQNVRNNNTHKHKHTHRSKICGPMTVSSLTEQICSASFYLRCTNFSPIFPPSPRRLLRPTVIVKEHTLHACTYSSLHIQTQDGLIVTHCSRRNDVHDLLTRQAKGKDHLKYTHLIVILF